MKRHRDRALASMAMLIAGLTAITTAQAATPPEIRVDYAYYSPESLVIKRYGWLEDEFKAGSRADQMGAEPRQQSRARVPE
jgi:sulfonate transport system substrate-binding protein